MEGELKGHLLADFGSVDAGSVELAIEDYAGSSVVGTVTLLLFPVANDIELATDVGSVIKGDTVPVDVPFGVLNFNGTNSAPLPKRPQYSSPVLKVLFAFDAAGKRITVSTRYDAKTNSIVTNQICYAAISYSAYVSVASKLIYTPARSSLNNGGVSNLYGVIAAYRPPGAVVIHQVSPTSLENGTSETEIYRIVSEFVATPDGAFEKPPNYPADGNYPGKTFVLPTDTYLITERVHEAGYFDFAGRAYTRTQNVIRLRPYDDDITYVPTLVCKEASFAGNQDAILKAKNYIASRGLGCK